MRNVSTVVIYVMIKFCLDSCVNFITDNRLSSGSQPFEISLDLDTNGPRPVSSFMAPESGFIKKASSLQRESNKVSTLNKVSRQCYRYC